MKFDGFLLRKLHAFTAARMRMVAVACYLAGGLLGVQGAKADDGLKSAFLLGYRDHPDLQDARAKLEAAIAQVALDHAGTRPTVHLNAAAGLLRDSTAVVSTPGAASVNAGFDYRPRKYGVEVSLPVYQGGALRASIRQSEALLAVQSAQVRDTEQKVFLGIAVACSDIQKAMRDLESARRYESQLSQALQGVAGLVARQDATRTDQGRGESRLANARIQLSQSQIALEAARASYKAWTGEPPPELASCESTAALPASAQEALAQAMVDHPNLEAVRRGINATRTGVDTATAGWLPAMNLATGVRRAREAQAWEISDTTRYLTLNASLSLYAGGATASRVRQAEQVLRQRELDLQESQSALQAAVAEAWYGLLATQDTLAARVSQVAAVQRSLQGMTRQREQRSFFELLDAHRELYNAEVSLHVAQREATLGRWLLLARTGGLTAARLGLQ
ncbi:TolC family protein [Ottowia thiooxydans]|uniref:TolC family protein n=1 Tax=Ottowia thiooxydans TaxID=219182 RepID=UPI00042666EB|nr:TolC family protein [Ottowia thiooxydans]